MAAVWWCWESMGTALAKFEDAGLEVPMMLRAGTLALVRKVDGTADESTLGTAHRTQPAHPVETDIRKTEPGAFPVVRGERTRNNGHQWKHERTQLGVKTTFFSRTALTQAAH